MKKIYDFILEEDKYSLKRLFLVFLAGGFSALICCYFL